ncbi:hypothetical protein E2C01_069850 [Portunus trituberculatus]|uniref:Uncharacterized protein n=1 Tax=Portunus trituberculatus TaxID=210409 RepID=A0A5B7HVN1_PORTR|nr:hypothetical protein [Portunus trituberculatus]
METTNSKSSTYYHSHTPYPSIFNHQHLPPPHTPSIVLLRGCFPRFQHCTQVSGSANIASRKSHTATQCSRNKRQRRLVRSQQKA